MSNDIKGADLVTPEVAKSLADLCENLKAAYAAKGFELDIVHAAFAILPTKNNNIAGEGEVACLATFGQASDMLLLCAEVIADAAVRTKINDVAAKLGGLNVH